jgi:predicted membrane protein
MQINQKMKLLEFILIIVGIISLIGAMLGHTHQLAITLLCIGLFVLTKSKPLNDE